MMQPKKGKRKKEMEALNYVKRFGDVWILVMDGSLPLEEVSKFQDVLEDHNLTLRVDGNTSCFRILDLVNEAEVKRARNNFNKLIVKFPVTSLCQVCGKPYGAKPSYCQDCKSTSYCSRECQKKDWGKHKMECTTLKKLGEYLADNSKIEIVE